MSTLTTPTIPREDRRPSSRIGETGWRIDPARSRIAFRTRSLWGLLLVDGGFGRYEGTLDLGREPAIELTIDASSLSTKNKLRDKHLRSADFFDVAHHPEIRFTSQSVSLDGDRLSVRGRLEAGGSSIPLELKATLRPVGDELELKTTTTVDHEELGMSSGLLGMIRSPSELIVEGRLIP